MPTVTEVTSVNLKKTGTVSRSILDNTDFDFIAIALTHLFSNAMRLMLLLAKFVVMTIYFVYSLAAIFFLVSLAQLVNAGIAIKKLFTKGLTIGQKIGLAISAILNLGGAALTTLFGLGTVLGCAAIIAFLATPSAIFVHAVLPILLLVTLRKFRGFRKDLNLIQHNEPLKANLSKKYGVSETDLGEYLNQQKTYSLVKFASMSVVTVAAFLSWIPSLVGAVALATTLFLPCMGAVVLAGLVMFGTMIKQRISNRVFKKSEEPEQLGSEEQPEIRRPDEASRGDDNLPGHQPIEPKEPDEILEDRHVDNLR